MEASTRPGIQSAFFQPLRIGALLLVLAAALPPGPAAAPAAKERLTAEEIEKALAAGNSRLIEPEFLAKIRKKEYPFLKKYLHDSDGNVRATLVGLLQHINLPFVQQYYQVLIRDSLHMVRFQAARGIYLLGRQAGLKVILGEIHRLDSMRGNEDRAAQLAFLVQAAGNFPGRKTLDTLTAFYQREKHPTTRAAYQKVLAKLGHKPSREEIEAELRSPNALTAKLAMEKVEYIGDPSWADKIKPLLLDERVPHASSFAGRRTQLRVCDYAVTVLGNIHPKKRMPFPVRAGTRYTEEQVAQARALYGLPQQGEEASGLAKTDSAGAGDGVHAVARMDSLGKVDSLWIGGAVEGAGD